jgi:hypothetical protein
MTRKWESKLESICKSEWYSTNQKLCTTTYLCHQFNQK